MRFTPPDTGKVESEKEYVVELIFHNVFMDLIVEVVNSGVKNGLNSKVSTGNLRQADHTLNALGILIVPLFFESLLHMDNLLFWGNLIKRGTLRETIEIYTRRNEILDIDDIVEFASEGRRYTFWLYFVQITILYITLFTIVHNRIKVLSWLLSFEKNILPIQN